MVVLLNPGAGAAAGLAADLKATVENSFAAAGIYPRILLPASDQMTAAAADAIEQGEQTIVVGGGDGTISAVAAQVIKSGRTLGVLPLGTLNHFAHDLGISDLSTAVGAIADGDTANVDVGEVNGRI